MSSSDESSSCRSSKSSLSKDLEDQRSKHRSISINEIPNVASNRIIKSKCKSAEEIFTSGNINQVEYKRNLLSLKKIKEKKVNNDNYFLFYF